MNKTVLITGASRGLGEQIFIKFAESGYNLILHSKERIPVIEQIEPCGVSIDMIQGDLKDLTVLLELSNIAKEKDIDIFINNAGVYSNEYFDEESYLDISNIIATNLTSQIQLLSKLWPIFVNRESGIIVNINSMAGKIANENESVYCASKFGARGFFESIQRQAPNGVDIINVYCGAMKTDMTKGRKDRELLIDPIEVADAIVTLCGVDYMSMRIPEIHFYRRNY